MLAGVCKCLSLSCTVSLGMIVLTNGLRERIKNANHIRSAKLGRSAPGFLYAERAKGANEMTQNEEKTPKSQKIQDRIIMAMIWIVAALVIALVLGTALNYINIFK